MISNAISKTSVVYNTSRIILFELNHQGFLFTSWFSYWSNTPCCLTVPRQDPGSEANTTERRKKLVWSMHNNNTLPWCGGGMMQGMMATAVSNNQLPSYMCGYLYPLDSRNGVFSYVRWVSRGCSEIVMVMLLGDFWFIIYATQIYRIVKTKHRRTDCCWTNKIFHVVGTAE